MVDGIDQTSAVTRDAALEERISRGMELQGYDLIVAASSESFTYLTGAVLPFAPNYPNRRALAVRTQTGDVYVICPVDWAEPVAGQRTDSTIIVYSEAAEEVDQARANLLVKLLADVLPEPVRVGLEYRGVTQRFLEVLGNTKRPIDFAACDDWLIELRSIKTAAEIALIERAVRQSDIGILFALQHMEGSQADSGYTLAEFSERIRVHVYESGGSGVGHMAVLQGADARLKYVLPRGRFVSGKLIRMEVTNHFHGYWSDMCRMAVIGSPSERQTVSYQKNLVLKNAALDMLKPGIECSAVQCTRQCSPLREKNVFSYGRSRVSVMGSAAESGRPRIFTP
jgi:Xaa-Pro aminopeptidase